MKKKTKKKTNRKKQKNNEEKEKKSELTRLTRQTWDSRHESLTTKQKKKIDGLS